MKARTFTLETESDAANLHALLRSNWRECAAKGKPLDVTVETHKNRRTLKQNAGYRGVILATIARDGWYEGRQWPAHVWHEYFRQMFLTPIEGPGGTVSYPSTADLTDDEMSDFMNEVQAWASVNLALRIVWIEDIEPMGRAS